MGWIDVTPEHMLNAIRGVEDADQLTGNAMDGVLGPAHAAEPTSKATPLAA